MSWHYYQSDRRASEARVEKEIERRRAKGEPFVPLEAAVRRGAIATSFWGQAWCRNLEAYSDYSNRLPRGRTYLRGGHVYDMEISSGYVFAYVAGTGLYEVEISIKPLPKRRWKALASVLSGEVGNLVDLLAGTLGPGVMEAVTDLDAGLFPKPKEISIACSCPDWATLCKHAAAVLYGVGARLDQSPQSLFLLRGVDHRELVDTAGASVEALTAPRGRGPDANLADAGLDPGRLAELFGINLAAAEDAFPDSAPGKGPASQ